MLWCMAFAVSVAISMEVIDRGVRSGPVVVGTEAESEDPLWLAPVPDLQSIHLHPGFSALLQRIEVDPRLAAVVLDPAQVQRVQQSCPPRRPELVLLCEAELLEPLVAEIEQVLMDALGDPDDAVALWAVELLVARGTRGAFIARQALKATDAVHRLERQQTMAVTVIARTLPAEEAGTAMRDLLDRSGPIAAMAALELARLGDRDALVDLERAQTRYTQTIEGVVIGHAVQRLTEDQASSSL